MSNTTTTAYMSLVLPIPGLELGPAWASEIDTAFTVIDQHNHTPGQGVAIPSTGLNINSDLPFNTNNAISLRSTRFVSQASPLALTTDLNALYVSGGNLFFNDSNSNQIQLTIAGAVDVSGSGNISGMGATTATVVYTAFNNTFTFHSNVNTPANISVGPITIGTNTALSKTVTITPSGSQSANYAYTLPTSLPVSTTSLLSVDTSGNMSNIAPDNVTTQIVGGQLQAIIPQFPTGTIVSFAGTAFPVGWALCAGQAFSRTTFSTLFSIIGTDWGQGDGSTTFNLPDLQGYFLRMVSGGTGRDPDANSRTAINPGGNTGNNVGSVQASTFASHTHTQTAHTHTQTAHAHQTNATDESNINYGVGSTITGVSGGVGHTAPSNLTESVTPTIASTTAVNNNTGGSETRALNAYVYFIIKT